MIPDYYDAIYALWKETEGLCLRSSDKKKTIVAFLQKNPTLCFVCVEGEKLLGTVMAGSDGRRGTIYHLMVASDFRGKGIGKKLMHKVITSLKKLGIKKAQLFIVKGNKLAEEFYSHLGWIKRDDCVMYSLPMGD